MHLGRRNPRTSLRRDVEADGANTMEPSGAARLIHYYRSEHHRKPSCFCESKEG